MSKTEQVARAIASAEQQPDAWQTYERAAIAAQLAMIGPTSAMISAFDLSVTDEPDASLLFDAMVRAGLDEKP